MTLVPLTSLEDSRLDAYARLTEAQLRSKIEPEKGIFIAESFKVIERALQAGYEPISFLLEEKWIDRCETLFSLKERDIPAFVLPTEQIRELAGFTLTRGILAALRRPALPSVREVISDAQCVAVMEEISDPTNLGAIFRNAAALKIDAVLLAPTCSDPFLRRTVRVSMGSVFQVPWTRATCDATEWPESVFEALQQLGFTTIALALSEDALDIRDPMLKQAKKRALFFGGEAHGLKAATIAACDQVAKIPMAHGVDSLNVAASSAVAFWELCNKID